MPIVTLPSAQAGQSYNQCIDLTGNPQSLGAVSLPDGLTAKLVGGAVCISGVPKGGGDVYIAVISCSTCDVLELTGTIEYVIGDDPCPCVPASFPTSSETWTDVAVGTYFEKYIPYNGSDIEFCSDCLPACLEACLVGRSIKLYGTLKKKVEEIRIAIKNSCTCECQEFVAVIEEPCNVTGPVVTAMLDCALVPLPAPTPSPSPVCNVNQAVVVASVVCSGSAPTPTPAPTAAPTPAPAPSSCSTSPSGIQNPCGVLSPATSFNFIFPDPGGVQVFNVPAGQAVVLPFFVSSTASFGNSNIQFASDSRSTPSGQSETVAVELWSCVNGVLTKLQEQNNGSGFKTIYITTGTSSAPYSQLSKGTVHWIVLRSIGGQAGGGIITSSGINLSDGNQSILVC